MQPGEAGEFSQQDSTGNLYQVVDCEHAHFKTYTEVLEARQNVISKKALGQILSQDGIPSLLMIRKKYSEQLREPLN